MSQAPLRAQRPGFAAIPGRCCFAARQRRMRPSRGPRLLSGTRRARKHGREKFLWIECVLCARVCACVPQSARLWRDVLNPFVTDVLYL